MAVSASQFLIDELRAARIKLGLSQEEFGKLISYSGSHVSGVETGSRPPKQDYVRVVDKALDTGGLFERMLIKLVLLDGAPVWLRPWIEIESDATSLRWYEPLAVPGLLQTEAYAHATLRGEMLSPRQIDQLVASRIARQALLTREQPPLLVAVLDESVLYRQPYGDKALMIEQLERLVQCAELPTVQVHIVPTRVGMHAGIGGSFIIATRDGIGPAACADSQLSSTVVDRAEDIDRLTGRWERIRGEALPMTASLDLIKEAATS